MARTGRARRIAPVIRHGRVPVNLPTLVAAYLVQSAGSDTTTLTTPSFTPANGEIIVVKASSPAGDFAAYNTPTGGTLTYTQRGFNNAASHDRAALWTAPVATSPGAMAVSWTWAGGANFHSFLVERWSNAQLAATPATVTALYTTGSPGLPSTTITTTGTNSVVTALNTDWNAVVATSRAYVTSSGTPQETGFATVAGNYVTEYFWQYAATPGSQTIGMTAPGGQAWTILGVELQALQPTQTYNVNLSGSVTAAGALTRQPTARKAGTTTPVGALVRQIATSKAGSVTPAGAFATAKVKVATLAGSVTPAGALGRTATRLLAGTATAAGALTRQMNVSRAGTLTPAGALIRQATRLLGGSTTPAGALTASKLAVSLSQVGVLSGLSNSAVTSYTPDTWPTVATGDLIVIYATTATTGPANITATAPGGAAYDVGADIASGTVARTVRLSRVAASNGEGAPTINHSIAANGTCAGVVLRGQNTTYLDVTETTATTGATATTVALPNLTTVTAGDWLLVGYAARAPAAPYANLSGPAGFTEQAERKNTATGSGSSTAVYTRNANPVAVGTYGGETFTEDVAGGLRQNIIHTAIRAAPAGAGTTFPVTLAGSVTAAGALVRQATRQLVSSTTPAGALRRTAARALAGTLTPAGALARTLARALTGSTTASGALATARVRPVALAGSTSAAGVLSRLLARTLTGSTTPAGTLARTPLHRLSGSSTPAGTLATVKVKLVAFVSSTTPAGALARSLTRTLTSSTTASGALVRTTLRRFTSSTTASGALQTLKVKLANFTGSVTAAGTLKRTTTHVATSTTAAAGTLVRAVTHRLTATVTASGVLLVGKVAARTFAGSVTAAGTLRRTATRLLSSSTSAAGTFARATTHRLGSSTTASGALQAAAGLRVNLAGTLTASGVLRRTLARALAGSATPTGAVRTSPRKALSGALTAAGTLSRTMTRRLSGVTSAAGQLSANVLPRGQIAGRAILVGRRWTAHAGARRYMGELRVRSIGSDLRTRMAGAALRMRGYLAWLRRRSS